MCHNLNDFLSFYNVSIWKMHRISLWIFFVKIIFFIFMISFFTFIYCTRRISSSCTRRRSSSTRRRSSSTRRRSSSSTRRPSSSYARRRSMIYVHHIPSIQIIYHLYRPYMVIYEFFNFLCQNFKFFIFFILTQGINRATMDSQYAQFKIFFGHIFFTFFI